MLRTDIPRYSFSLPFIQNKNTLLYPIHFFTEVSAAQQDA